LGSNLVRELLVRGHDLRILVQPGRKVQTLDGLDLEKIPGDLLDFESLKSAAAGTEAIIHLAAHTNIWPSRNEMVKQVNIQGTQNIIRLALESNIKKLVYAGTANSYGFGSKENPGNEDTGYRGLRYGLDYMDSKWKAQQLIMQALSDGLPAVVVNPTFMFGPYDTIPNTGTMIMTVYRKKIPGYSPGGRNYIYVKDAAIGIANALATGRIGESYILGNENLSYKEILDKIASVVGVEPPGRYLPKCLLLAYGKMGSIISGITGKKPTVSYPMAKIACDKQYYSSEKAVRELTLPQTPVEVGISEAFNWLKTNGYIH